MSTATLGGSPRPVDITISLDEFRRALQTAHGLDPAVGDIAVFTTLAGNPDVNIGGRTGLKVNISNGGNDIAPATVSLVDVVTAGIAALQAQGSI